MASAKSTPTNNKPKTATGCGDDQEGWQLIAEGDWLVGQRFSIGEYAVLGRDTHCHITIPGTHLSRRHAEFVSRGNKLLIRDMGSANGTYVNGKQITETELNSGDSVRFDVLEFRIQGPAITKPKIKPTSTTALKNDRSVTPAKKQRKTKPTSVGNRHNTVQISAVKKTANSIGFIIATLLAAGILAALAYLFTQL